MKYIICILLMSSCIIRFVGVHHDYDLLSPQEKERIKKLETFDSLQSNYVYEINAPQLLLALAAHEKSLVYMFANGCTSDNCIPLSNIERFAEDNDYQLFLIMNGYYNLDKSLSQQLNSPLFSINSDYYGSSKIKKHKTAFKKELGYYQVSKEQKHPGSYLFFSKDSLIEIKKSIE